MFPNQREIFYSFSINFIHLALLLRFTIYFDLIFVLEVTLWVNAHYFACVSPTDPALFVEKLSLPYYLSTGMQIN